MAKMSVGGCRIRDVVRDSKILWDDSAKIDRKLDKYTMEMRHVLFDLKQDLKMAKCSVHGVERDLPRNSSSEQQRQQYSGFTSNFDEIEYWFHEYMKKEAVFLGFYQGNDKSESIVVRFKRNLPAFDGTWHTDDFMSWVDAIEDFFEEVNPPVHLKCGIVLYKMEGAARFWWNHLQNDRILGGGEEIISWPRMKNMLLNKFSPLKCSTKVPYEHKSVDGCSEEAKFIATKTNPQTPSIVSDAKQKNEDVEGRIKDVGCPKEMTDRNRSDDVATTEVILEESYSTLNAKMREGVKVIKHLQADRPTHTTCSMKFHNQRNKQENGIAATKEYGQNASELTNECAEKGESAELQKLARWYTQSQVMKSYVKKDLLELLRHELVVDVASRIHLEEKLRIKYVREAGLYHLIGNLDALASAAVVRVAGQDLIEVLNGNIQLLDFLVSKVLMFTFDPGGCGSINQLNDQLPIGYSSCLEVMKELIYERKKVIVPWSLLQSTSIFASSTSRDAISAQNHFTPCVLRRTIKADKLRVSSACEGNLNALASLFPCSLYEFEFLNGGTLMIHSDSGGLWQNELKRDAGQRGPKFTSCKTFMVTNKLFLESYLHWIVVGALLRFTVLFNFLFTFFLTYLNPVGRLHDNISEDELDDKDSMIVAKMADLAVGDPIHVYGIRRSSHIYSLFAGSVVIYGMVLHEGKVQATNDNEYSDPYITIPVTFGFLADADSRIIAINVDYVGNNIPNIVETGYDLLGFHAKSLHESIVFFMVHNNWTATKYIVNTVGMLACSLIFLLAADFCKMKELILNGVQTKQLCNGFLKKRGNLMKTTHLVNIAVGFYHLEISRIEVLLRTWPNQTQRFAASSVKCSYVIEYYLDQIVSTFMMKMGSQRGFLLSYEKPRQFAAYHESGLDGKIIDRNEEVFQIATINCLCMTCVHPSIFSHAPTMPPRSTYMQQCNTSLVTTLTIENMINLALQVLIFRFTFYITRGRVILWEGWNDEHNSNTEGKFISVELNAVTISSHLWILCKNGQLMGSSKLFYKVVNGLDPPKGSSSELGSFNVLNSPSSFDFARGRAFGVGGWTDVGTS